MRRTTWCSVRPQLSNTRCDGVDVKEEAERERTGKEERNTFTGSGADSGAKRSTFTSSGTDSIAKINTFTDSGEERNTFTDSGTDKGAATNTLTDSSTGRRGGRSEWM